MLQNFGLLEGDIKKLLEEVPRVSSYTKETLEDNFIERTTRYFYSLYLINFIPFWIEVFFDDLALENLVAHTDDSIGI